MDFRDREVAYIRTTRLNGVRRALKIANLNTDTVQDIAARWVFWHLSHFSTNYKLMFGELPRRPYAASSLSDLNKVNIAQFDICWR
ncbi:MAG: helix-turn-helix domain-containing protein [Oxalobacteraceae bacterium]